MKFLEDAILDLVFGRANPDGSRQNFQVSAEPIFSHDCRFIGYRGIGIEFTAKTDDHVSIP